MNGRGWGFAVGLSKCCWGFSFLVGFARDFLLTIVIQHNLRLVIYHKLTSNWRFLKKFNDPPIDFTDLTLILLC